MRYLVVVLAVLAIGVADASAVIQPPTALQAVATSSATIALTWEDPNPAGTVGGFELFTPGERAILVQADLTMRLIDPEAP